MKKVVKVKKEDLQKKIATDVCKAQPTHPTCKASKPKANKKKDDSKLKKLKAALKKAAVPKPLKAMKKVDKKPAA